MIPIYNFQSQKRGTSFQAIDFALKSKPDPLHSTASAPIDLTDVVVRVDFRVGSKDGAVVKKLTSESGTDITILNATEGKFRIKTFLIDMPVGKYFYDIMLIYPTGVVNCYVEGAFEVLQNVTEL